MEMRNISIALLSDSRTDCNIKHAQLKSSIFFVAVIIVCLDLCTDFPHHSLVTLLRRPSGLPFRQRAPLNHLPQSGHILTVCCPKANTERRRPRHVFIIIQTRDKNVFLFVYSSSR